MNSPRRLPSDWLLALTLLAGIYLWQRTAFPLWMVDLFHIQYAAYELKHGEEQWIYSTLDDRLIWMQHHAEVAAKLGAEGYANEHLYPPFLAGILMPLADASALSWRNVVFVLNVLLIAGFAILILANLDQPCTWRSLLWTTALLLCCYPLARATKLGQITPLLAAFCWYALLLMRRGNNTASGIILGAVAALKIFPIVFLAAPILAKRFRIIWTAIATIFVFYALSILTLGWSIHRSWLTTIQSYGNSVIPFFGNQSLPAFLVRISRDIPLDSMLPVVSSTLDVAERFVGIVCIIITILLVVRSRKNLTDSIEIAAVNALIAAVLLSIPNSWEHYWLFLLPALAWAIARQWNNLTDQLGSALIAVAAFFFLMKLTRFYGESTWGRIMSGSQMFGMIGLWLWMLRQMLRDHRNTGASVA